MRRIAALKDPTQPPYDGNIDISDDQIRESLEGAHLKLQRERGTDVTIFSPRASAMAHHIGDAMTSVNWSRHCNDPDPSRGHAVSGQLRGRVSAAAISGRAAQ
jgi:4-oxalmesaconate hydratase